jgi:hypothetical protein
MNKIILSLNEFVNKFEKLKETEKKNFSRIINKLLQVNYITIQKKTDINDYRFILLYQDIIRFFFQLADFDLEIKYLNEVIFIKNKQNWNKLKLSKEESLVLLVLSIFFYRKKELNNSHNLKIEIFLKDVYKELSNIGYTEIKKLNKEKMKKILSLFCKYNIINFPDHSNIIDDDLIICIYPTILYLIDLEMVKEYQKLLNLNNKK